MKRTLRCMKNEAGLHENLGFPLHVCRRQTLRYIQETSRKLSCKLPAAHLIRLAGSTPSPQGEGECSRQLVGILLMWTNEIRHKKNVDIRGSKGYTDVATQFKSFFQSSIRW